MASFEDTFSRNNQDSQLQFDDAAAYFFFSAIISIILFPLLIHVIKEVFKKPKFQRERIKCRWREEFNNEEFKKRKFIGTLYIKIFVTVLLLWLLAVCLYKGSDIKNLKTFDPYEILELDPTATDIEIKKAYKRLAKKLHPDLNPEDPDAQSKFIQLNQAYRCLTDEEIKEKCKMFGNPDGSNNFQVAIALPSALLNKKNRSIILAMFFLILLVFLPITIWIWYSEKEKYDHFGINKQSILQTTFFMKNENIRVQDVLEMMASSLEMLPIKTIQRGQGAALKEIEDPGLNPHIAKGKCPYLKPLFILNRYMNRGKMPECLKDDLNFMHRKIPYLLSSLSDFSLELTMKQIKLHNEMKPLTYNSFMNVLYFSQLYFQAMVPFQSPLYQLPNMTETIVTKATRKLKKDFNFAEVLKTPELQEKLLSCYDDARDQERAKSYIQLLPKVDFNIEVYVDIEGERSHEIHAMDLLKIEVSVTDDSVPEGKSAHYMQSQHYPYLKFINWHVFMLGLTDKKTTVIGDFRVLKGDQRTVKEEFPHRIPNAGKYKMKFLLMPDCYIGLEIEKELVFEILPERTEKDVFLHPEDEEAIKRPTLFTQLRQQMEGHNEDSDIEPEDEDATTSKGEKAAPQEGSIENAKEKSD